MQNRYLLDNGGAEAPARLAALSDLFDDTTKRLLTDRGVDVGWHCLEVGAGNGTIAAWLASRVGASGTVLATDIDTRHLAPLAGPNLVVQQHDISTDALPEGAFDLIHIRLVLNNVPEWRQVMRKLVAALKPGGWLV